MILQWLSAPRNEIWASLTVLVGWASAHLALRLWLKRTKLTPIQKHRVRLVVLTVTSITVVLSLVAVWSDELRGLVVALAAFAVAITVATKEMISSVLGWVLKLGTDSYELGERVAVSGVRGDVVGVGLLGTRVAEVGADGQRTGSVITIPHTRLLSEPLHNESRSGIKWIAAHRVLAPGDDVDALEASWVQIANQIAKESADEVSHAVHRFAQSHAIEPHSPKPVVHLRPGPELGDYLLTVRVPVPADGAPVLEDRLNRAVWKASPIPTDRASTTHGGRA